MKVRTTLPLIAAAALSVLAQAAQAQHHPTANIDDNKFRQLGPADIPTPNVYRNAAGAPGHAYYQNRADYDMDIRLDDETQEVFGEEVITYRNNSPDALDYLWLQLDQNMRARDSETFLIDNSSMRDRYTPEQLTNMEPWFDGGFKLDYVQYGNGSPADYTVNKTMMRVDLPEVLAPGEDTELRIKWHYNVNDRMKIGGRSGYEYFEEDDNYLYTIAQFFPRMCRLLRRRRLAEQAVPRARGVRPALRRLLRRASRCPPTTSSPPPGRCKNAERPACRAKQYDRWLGAPRSRATTTSSSCVPTKRRAVAREPQRAKKTKTWKFEAENVRDFGWASSRKFIWDAMAVRQDDGSTVMAMSMYPKEGNPLWERYSTKAVAHTLKWYTHYTFDYPYPVAWSINAARIGMEYPMICFNFGRPEADGTYSERTKYGMIGVIIHEVGHNYFPMIVNSDERQWTWMDEGLNTFLQYLSEQQWERDYPSRRGPADKIVDYMAGDKDNITPIMTNSESIYQFGNNAYGKPATALNILRETVMGREAFDHAFKTYANRWKFKHPEPADLFRTMEDASAYDLDWFWRGWFFTTDHVDQNLKSVRHYVVNPGDANARELAINRDKSEERRGISSIRNEREIAQTQDEKDPSLRDFYSGYDPRDLSAADRQDLEQQVSDLSPEARAMLDDERHFYELTIGNDGGLVMPIVIEWTYEDGTTEVDRIPAEIWLTDDQEVTKVFIKPQAATSISLDPFLETADTDRSDNDYPARAKSPSRFDVFERGESASENPMQRDRRAQEGSASPGN